MGLAARLFGRLTLQLGGLSGFATLAMMLVVVLDVGGRTFFNTPIPGGNEFCELLLVGMIFFGLAAAQKQRQHFAIEIATQHLPPALRRWIKLFGWLVSFAIVGLLAWVSAKQSWVSMLRGEASYGTISFPIWPARMVIAFGLGLLAAQLALDCVRLLSGRDQPHSDSSHS
jgi:TRAP-type C4-dicarboxylate transport system permease small subunit